MKHQTTQLIPFLVAVLILLCLLWFIKNTVMPTLSLQTNKTIITRNGSMLMLGSVPFTVVGVNQYDLAYKNNHDIDQTFRLLQQAGVTTIRFWLFGDGNPDGFQPEAGIYNEQRFKQADYVFYEAQKYHIKLIPTLVNNWDDYGGKSQYLRWSGKDPTQDPTLFYTDSQSRALFEHYLSYVLARKNTYTHIQYADDPTILGWDIMNEPRSLDQTSMNSWLISMAEYIKERDPNHLVFAGTEVATAPFTSQDESANLCESPAIDICSVHLYLFHDDTPLFHSYEEITNFLLEQATYAEQVNKPLLMEEFGIAQDTRPFNQDQLPMMKQLIDVIQQDGYAGYLIWDWANTQTSTFTFSPTGDAEGHYSLTDLENLIK